MKKFKKVHEKPIFPVYLGPFLRCFFPVISHKLPKINNLEMIFGW